MLRLKCIDQTGSPNIFEMFENIRSSNQIKSNTEIQSLNMFRSDILNIRKVRIGSNMQCFEFFGQPTANCITIIKVSKYLPHVGIIAWPPQIELSNEEFPKLFRKLFVGQFKTMIVVQFVSDFLLTLPVFLVNVLVYFSEGRRRSKCLKFETLPPELRERQSRYKLLWVVLIAVRD